MQRKEQGDEQAREKLILSYVCLVGDIAKKYTNRGIPYHELINEGYVGLVRGVNKAAREQKGSPTSYIYKWVNNAIKNKAAQGNHIVTPKKYTNRKAAILNRIIEAHEYETQETPSAEELGHTMGIPPENIQALLDIKKINTSIDFHGRVDHRYRLTYAESIPNPMAPCPITFAAENENTKILDDLMTHLTAKQKFVIEHFFGLNEKPRKSLEAIGKMLGGITRSATGDLKEEGLRKMRKISLTRNPASIRKTAPAKQPTSEKKQDDIARFLNAIDETMRNQMISELPDIQQAIITGLYIPDSNGNTKTMANITTETGKPSATLYRHKPKAIKAIWEKAHELQQANKLPPEHNNAPAKSTTAPNLEPALIA